MLKKLKYILPFFSLFSINTTIAQSTNITPGQLLTFAKVYKTARYFYPTHKYTEPQWDTLLLEGLNKVLKIPENEFEKEITSFYKEYLPLIKVTSDSTLIGKGNTKQVFWQRIGFVESGTSTFSKRLVNSLDFKSNSGIQFWIDKIFMEDSLSFEVNFKAKRLTNKKEKLKVEIEGYRVPNRKDSIVNHYAYLSKNWNNYSFKENFNTDQLYFMFFFGKEGLGDIEIKDISYKVYHKDSLVKKQKINLNLNDIRNVANSSIQSPFGYNFELKNGSLLINNNPDEDNSLIFKKVPTPNSYQSIRISNNSFIQIPISIDYKTFEREKAKDIPNKVYSEQIVYLGALVKAYSVFSIFFPYQKDLNIDSDSFLLEFLPDIINWKSERIAFYAIKKYIARYKDGHAAVISDVSYSDKCIRSDFEKFSQGIFSIGSDSSCLIKKGDQLLQINHDNIEKVITKNCSYRSGSKQFCEYMETFIIGCGDSTLIDKYTIKRGRDTLEFKIKKDWYVGQYAKAILPPVSLLDSNVYYVDLSRLMYNEFKDSISTFSNSNGIIFDLRKYPRLAPDFLMHFTYDTLTSTNWMKPVFYGGMIDSLNYIESPPWKLLPKQPKINVPIVFLIGPYTISGAESLLEIIKNYHLGTVIGTKSAGANGNKTAFTFPNGFRFSFTGMNVKMRDGTSFFSTGIKPDIYYKEKYTESRDDLIQFANRYIITQSKK